MARATARLEALPERFRAKVWVTESFPLGLDKGPCWEWLGCKTPRGYGQYFPPRSARNVPRPRVYAYRYTYEFFKGPIPPGLEPDHLCRWPPCVNPEHLEAVTRGENMRRSTIYTTTRRRYRRRETTHCPSGHPYDLFNTYYRPDRPGRNCKECKREANRRWARNQSRV